MTRQHSPTGTPVARRASLQRKAESEDTEVYDDVWPPPVPRSALRYTRTTDNTPVVVVGNRRYVLHSGPPPNQKTHIPQEEAAPRQRRRVHPMLFLGAGMFMMLCLWILGNALVSWWNITRDDLSYGRPRTFQVDAIVGHADSPTHPTHFIAINYDLHIQVIEEPGGDTTHARIYQVATLYGDGQNLAPVTLTFKDLNGDGKPDMLIHVSNTTIYYLNDNGVFRPLKTGEQVTT